MLKLVASALIAPWVMGASAVCAEAQAPNHAQRFTIVESAEESMRDDAGLHAQEVAAYWTRIAAIAAISGVFVSAVGLLFIYQQLKHSAAAVREAARSSESAAEAAQAALLSSRPWLKVEYSNEGRVYKNSTSPSRLVIPVTMTNVGATPAITASTYAILIDDGQQETLDEAIKSFLAKEPKNSETIFPNDSSIMTGWNVDLTNGTHGLLWVAVLTSYRFSGSRLRHISGVVLGVSILHHEAPETSQDGTLAWRAHAHLVPNLRVDAT